MRQKCVRKETNSNTSHFFFVNRVKFSPDSRFFIACITDVWRALLSRTRVLCDLVWTHGISTFAENQPILITWQSRWVDVLRLISYVGYGTADFRVPLYVAKWRHTHSSYWPTCPNYGNQFSRTWGHYPGIDRTNIQWKITLFWRNVVFIFNVMNEIAR